jgi:hypothetical protein
MSQQERGLPAPGRPSGAYVRGANLKFARVVVADDQLSEASSLEGATVPNGQKYEDWLKSKGSGEDGDS